MKEIIKKVSVGTGVSTATFLVLLLVVIVFEYLPWDWWPHDDARLLELLVLLGSFPATIYFLIKKSWWSVTGSTLGYIVILVLLSWLFEIGAGPAGL